MRELLTWNVNLGRIAGIPIRLHALFLLLATIVVFAASRGDQQDLLWYGTFLAVLFVSVLAAELLQCAVAMRLKGEISEVVLWPLGGLSPPRVPARPSSELLLAVVGLLFYLTTSVAGMGVLLWQQAPLGEVLTPFTLPYDVDFSWLTVAKIAVWTNLWLLFGLNLLPAMPLAGGRALQSGLWAMLGRSWAAALTARVTQVTGVLVCVAAWWIPSMDHFEFAWMPVVFLGMLLFFGARPDRLPQPEPMVMESSLPEPVEEPGHFSLNEPESFEAEHVSEWLQARQEEKLRRQREQEEEEDRRVDEILARLHQTGVNGLSPDDRALLDRVSARYRNRQQG